VRPTPHQHDGQGFQCPPWCRRDHHPDDRPDDLLHQSDPEFVAVIHGDPLFGPDHEAWPDSVVLRLAQRVDSTTVWLEATSEEGRSLRLLVTADSARRLAYAVTALLAVL
jgi:hypothetical protein